MVYDEVFKNYFGGLKDISSMEKYVWMYEMDSLNDGYKVVKFYFFKFNFKSFVFF